MAAPGEMGYSAPMDGWGEWIAVLLMVIAVELFFIGLFVVDLLGRILRK